MRNVFDNWKDSEIKYINGQRFSVVYDLGKYPMWQVVTFDRYGRDLWTDCNKEMIESAVAEEYHRETMELEDHYDDERPSLSH